MAEVSSVSIKGDLVGDVETQMEGDHSINGVQRERGVNSDSVSRERIILY